MARDCLEEMDVIKQRYNDPLEDLGCNEWEVEPAIIPSDIYWPNLNA
jgi:hypothetical protein